MAFINTGTTQSDPIKALLAMGYQGNGMEYTGPNTGKETFRSPYTGGGTVSVPFTFTGNPSDGALSPNAAQFTYDWSGIDFNAVQEQANQAFANQAIKTANLDQLSPTQKAIVEKYYPSSQEVQNSYAASHQSPGYDLVNGQNVLSATQPANVDQTQLAMAQNRAAGLPEQPQNSLAQLQVGSGITPPSNLVNPQPVPGFPGLSTGNNSPIQSGSNQIGPTPILPTSPDFGNQLGALQPAPLSQQLANLQYGISKNRSLPGRVITG